MSERAIAAASYIPVPGLAFLLVRAAPESRLARFHAWQGGLTVLLGLALLIGVGALVRVAPVEPVAGVVLVAFVAALVHGAVSAARGRYGRVRGVWDLLAALAPAQSRPMRAS